MKTKYGIYSIILIIITAQSLFAGLFEMLYMEDAEISLPIESNPDKATVVFLNDLQKPSLFMYYADTKLLGETFSASYFVSEIDPGEQWIYIVPRLRRDKVVDEIRAAKITFEKGKVYYFLFKFITMSFNVLSPQSPEEFETEVKESKLRALKFVEGKNDVIVVKEKWLEEAREEFEEDVEENEEHIQDILNYRGY